MTPTFHKINVLHKDLKKDTINKFGIKYIEYQSLYWSNFYMDPLIYEY
jgi:hypothetical protein